MNLLFLPIYLFIYYLVYLFVLMHSMCHVIYNLSYLSWLHGDQAEGVVRPIFFFTMYYKNAFISTTNLNLIRLALAM